MRLAFVTDDLGHHAGVHLRHEPDGTVVASVDSDAEPDVVARQVRRILSLDQPEDEWLAVGERDPVIGRLQRAHPGPSPHRTDPEHLGRLAPVPDPGLGAGARGRRSGRRDVRAG